MTTKRLRLEFVCLLMLFFVAFAGSSQALAQQLAPVSLGTLGGNLSQPVAVNASGQVIGSSRTGLGRDHAFSWTESGGMVDLGTLGGTSTYASAVNDSGQVIGISQTLGNAAFHAFSWTQSGGMIDLGTLGGPNSTVPLGFVNNTVPLGRFALNASGQVVGDSALTAPNPFGNYESHAFSWTQSGGMVDLGVLGRNPFLLLPASSARAVNDSGQVIGSSQTTERNTFHAFSWTQSGGMVDLAPPNTPDSMAQFVNASGQVAGQIGNHAFSWTQSGGMVDLGTLGGLRSGAIGLNASGQIAGSSEVNSLGTESNRPFSWTQSGGMVDLGALGGSKGNATALNDAGQVVGWATLAGDVVHHAFLWTQSGGMIDLGTLGGANSDAVALNASGQVIGASRASQGGDHAFSWTQSGGMVDLAPLPGGIASVAVALNDSGLVVGYTLKPFDNIPLATIWRTVNNTTPTITAAVDVTRQQDAGPSNSLIATVSDAQDAMTALTVVVNGSSSATANGVSVSDIALDSAGHVTATVSAACGATGASFTLRVTDTGSLFAEATLNVFVALETTPPVINPILNVVATLPLNSVATSMPVTFPLPTATDNCSAATVVTSPVSAAVFGVGATTVNVTATDGVGNPATSSFTVTVQYNFAGFFQPVDNPPTFNTASAGQAIPVKFSLSGNKGANIFAAGYPTSVPIACPNGSGAPIEEIVANASGSFLQYDSGADRYTYVWKTDRSWAGTCRQLVVMLNDGTTYSANFQFR